MKPDSKILMVLPVALALAASSGCGSSSSGGSATEDTSASGMAAQSVGGALGGSSGNGTMSLYRPSSARALYASIMNALLPEANASSACPTLKTANGAGCTNGSNVVTLAYNSCSFGSSSATWSGNLQIGATGIACGSFPSITNGTLTRQFVDGSGNPGSGSRTSSFGTVVTVDHKTANLGNFNNDTITANIGSGYGTSVTFSNGARTQVQIRQHVSSTGFDHSLNGTVNISESSGNTSRTVSGSLTLYHNKVKVIATTTFNNVTFTDTCCQPTAGSVSTAFSAGSNVNPIAAGQALVGKSETLTFTGCGTGTLQGTDGSSTSVTLSHCF